MTSEGKNKLSSKKKTECNRNTGKELTALRRQIGSSVLFISD